MSNTIIFLVFAVLAAIYVFFGIIPFVKAMMKKKRCTQRVDAEVVGFSDKRTGAVRNNHYYNAVYRYYLNGAEYNVSGTPLFSKTGAVGVQKTLFVNPMKPDEIYEQEEMGEYLGPLLLMTVVVAIFGFAFGTMLNPDPNARAFSAKSFDVAFPIIALSAIAIPVIVLTISAILKHRRCTYPVKGVIQSIEQRERMIERTHGSSDITHHEKQIYYVERLKFYYKGREYDADGMQCTDKSLLGSEGGSRELFINPNDPSESRVKTRHNKGCIILIIAAVIIFILFMVLLFNLPRIF